MKSRGEEASVESPVVPVGALCVVGLPLVVELGKRFRMAGFSIRADKIVIVAVGHRHRKPGYRRSEVPRPTGARGTWGDVRVVLPTSWWVFHRRMEKALESSSW